MVEHCKVNGLMSNGLRVFAEKIFSVKIHCAVDRFITCIKISPKGASAIATPFPFCLSVLSSEKTSKW